MEGLLALGVDGPERACNEIDTDAVAGVLRWARDQNRKGNAPSSGQIVNKLKNGGLAGYGTQAEAPRPWWCTRLGRVRWIEGNVSDLDCQWAEVAVISLTQQKSEPTEELVREWALIAEKQQAEHDEVCRESAKAQKATKVPPGGAEGLKKVKAREVLEKAA